MRRLVVVGAGELGGRVAARWVALGGEAIGLTATSRRHPELRAAGVSPSIRPPADVVLPDDLVLLSVSGSAAQARAAAALRGLPHARAVMVGTTGIFGDIAGPVDVRTPPAEGARAQAAAAAEAALRQASAHAVVVRMGGLYRRGRGPVQALLRRGSPPSGPPDRTLALIHYDDAASALVAALAHPDPDPVYLGVVPPLPSRADFYALATQRHGLPAPELTQPTGEPARTYDVASLQRDLLPRPAHPDWREATEG